MRILPRYHIPLLYSSAHPTWAPLIPRSFCCLCDTRFWNLATNFNPLDPRFLYFRFRSVTDAWDCEKKKKKKTNGSNIGLVTKWLRILSLNGNDKIRNHLVANPIVKKSSFWNGRMYSPPWKIGSLAFPRIAFAWQVVWNCLSQTSNYREFPGGFDDRPKASVHGR